MLLEAAAYAFLLTESERLQFLVRSQGERAAQQFENERATGDATAVAAVDAIEAETPAERIVYYISQFDPTQNKQNTQWLVVRYAQGTYHLEDLPDVTQYLTLFEKAKKRLAKRDINQYANIGELWQALQPFMQGQQAVSRSAERDIERMKFSARDQANIVYDSPELLIVTPLTLGASRYWGKNTKWCTTVEDGHQFKRYTSQGPLFIILDKANNRRWQFHFETGQFMNELDQRVPIGDVVAKFPVIVQAIGEVRFASQVKELGLSYFSRPTIDRLPPEVVYASVKSIDDLKYLSREAITPALMSSMLAKPKQIAQYYAEWMAYAKKNNLISDEVLSSILQVNPRLYAALPQHLQTPEALQATLAKCVSFADIEAAIPEPWDQKTKARFWNLKVSMDTSLRIKDVPKEFLTQSTMGLCLRRRPQDIPQWSDRLDIDTMEYILKDNFEKAVPHFPAKIRNHDWFVDKLTGYVVSVNDHQTKPFGLFTFIDPAKWPQTIADKIVAQARKPVRFEDIARFDSSVRREWARYHPVALAEAPPAEITPAILNTALESLLLGNHLTHATKETYSDQAVKVREDIYSFFDKISPTVMTPDTLAAKIDTRASYFSAGYFRFSSECLPKKFRTNGVILAGMKIGQVPIKSMPKELMTAELIAERLFKNKEEHDEVPTDKYTADMSRILISKDARQFDIIPQSHYCEPVLHAYLIAAKKYLREMRSYGQDALRKQVQKNFEKFPKSMWSDRVCAAAIDAGVLEPDAQIPEPVLDTETATAILMQDESQYEKLAGFLDQPAYCKLVSSNYDIQRYIPQDKWTEPMIYAALCARPSTDTLLNMPRDKWSARCYAEALGQTITLKEVPKKLQTDELIAHGVSNSARVLADLPDGAEWLTKNRDKVRQLQFVNKNDDHSWWHTLETIGIAPKGKKFVSVADQSRQELKSGGSYTLTRVGPTNFRFFLFDKKGNILLRFLTNQGKVESVAGGDGTRRYDFVELRPQIVELLEKEPILGMIGFPSWHGEKMHIYPSRGTYKPIEKLDHKKLNSTDKLEWAETNSYGEKYSVIAFLGDKPVLVLEFASDNYASKLEKLEALVPEKRLFPYCEEIASVVQHYGPRHNNRLLRLGIKVELEDGGHKAIPLLARKIMTADSLSVYRSDNFVSVVSDQFGLICWDELKEDGTWAYRRWLSFDFADSLEPKINEVFEAIRQKIKYLRPKKADKA